MLDMLDMSEHYGPWREVDWKLEPIEFQGGSKKKQLHFEDVAY
jgi:hypothetical protein